VSPVARFGVPCDEQSLSIRSDAVSRSFVAAVQSLSTPSTRTTHYMTTATTATATKQVAINDIGSAEDFLAAVELTIKSFNDGDLIEGTVVKVDRDEVLVDVG